MVAFRFPQTAATGNSRCTPRWRISITGVRDSESCLRLLLGDYARSYCAAREAKGQRPTDRESNSHSVNRACVTLTAHAEFWGFCICRLMLLLLCAEHTSAVDGEDEAGGSST